MMGLDLLSLVIGAVGGWLLGFPTAAGLAVLLTRRDRKRKHQQAMDNACNELEGGR